MLSSSQEPSYYGSMISQIFPGEKCLAGNRESRVEGAMSGRDTVFSRVEQEANWQVPHLNPGVLSLYDYKSSKFNITFKKQEELDGWHPVFGKTVYGFDVLRAVSDEVRRPTASRALPATTASPLQLSVRSALDCPSGERAGHGQRATQATGHVRRRRHRAARHPSARFPEGAREAGGQGGARVQQESHALLVDVPSHRPHRSLIVWLGCWPSATLLSQRARGGSRCLGTGARGARGTMPNKVERHMVQFNMP